MEQSPGLPREVTTKQLGISVEEPLVILVIEDDQNVHWASKGVPRSIMLAKPFAPVQLITAVSQLLNIGMPTA